MRIPVPGPIRFQPSTRGVRGKWGRIQFPASLERRPNAAVASVIQRPGPAVVTFHGHAHIHGTVALNPIKETGKARTAMIDPELIDKLTADRTHRYLMKTAANVNRYA